jgi:ferredoxin
MTKLQIDPNRCMGHGLCYSEVPDLIEDDDRGLAHVRGRSRVIVRTRQRSDSFPSPRNGARPWW